MRSTLTAFFALACVLFLSSLPASAASRWGCDGPEFVCGDTGSVTAPTYQDDDARPARRAARSKAARNTRARNTRQQTAVVDQPAPRPVRAKRARSQDGNVVSSGGSYSGQASYYWQPQRVASGGWFNPNAMTAAHKTLPFGTRVRVTNQRNGRSVVVTINDRGPYIRGRIIDLSSAAAGVIGMKNSGVVPVSVAVLGRG